MNDLLKVRLLGLLAEPSQEVTNRELQKAYGDFMKQVEILSQSEIEDFKAFQILNITRVELLFIESLYQYEPGGKCAERSIPSQINFTY